MSIEDSKLCLIIKYWLQFLKCIICSAALFKDSWDKGNEATRL